MAKKKSLLEKMRANPRADWTIADVETLCRQNGLQLCKPKSGSHYMVLSEIIEGGQSVPARRPIKPIYIRNIVRLCESHLRFSQGEPE